MPRERSSTLRTEEEELECRCAHQRAELKLALEGLSRDAQQYVHGLVIKDWDELNMARVLAPGYTLAYERRVVGHLAPEFTAWRKRVRMLMAQGRLPRLKALQPLFRPTWHDDKEARIMGWSLEKLSPEARAVLCTILRPPVRPLDIGVVLGRGFPFSMYGASAACILELEDWQRRLEHQPSFAQLGPLTRLLINRMLVSAGE